MDADPGPLGGGWVVDASRNSWRVKNGEPDAVEIILKYKGEHMITTADATAHTILKDYRWCAKKDGKNFYAIAHYESIGHASKYVCMHRLLKPHLAVVDHKNGNGLDNRSANLRDGSGGVNAHNVRAKGKGVYTPKGKNIHVAQWTDANKKRHNKTFRWVAGDDASKREKYDEAVAFSVAKKEEIIKELISRQPKRAANDEVDDAANAIIPIKKKGKTGVATVDEKQRHHARWVDEHGVHRSKTFAWATGNEDEKKAQYQVAVAYRTEQQALTLIALKAKNPAADKSTHA